MLISPKEGHSWVERKNGLQTGDIGRRAIKIGPVGKDMSIYLEQLYVEAPNNVVDKTGHYLGSNGRKYHVVVGSKTVTAVDLEFGYAYNVNENGEVVGGGTVQFYLKEKIDVSNA